MGIIKEKYIVNNKGKKTAIILPMKRYEQLLEDLHDLAVQGEQQKKSGKPLSDDQKKVDLQRHLLKKQAFHLIQHPSTNTLKKKAHLNN